MAHTPPIGSSPLDLERALASRPDAAALRATWDALPAPAPDRVLADRQARAWARLTEQLDAPGRVPYREEVPVPLMLVDEATPASAPASASAIALPRGGARGVRARIVLAAAAALTITTLAVMRTSSQTLTAPANRAPQRVHLADGSDITLAPGASLRVPRALGWPTWLAPRVRDVQLAGAAFFEVAHDGRPFTVHTADATVRVVGTRFEVRAPIAGVGTRVAVESGRVQVRARADGSGTGVMLGAGERTRVGGTMAVGRAATDRIAVWRRGGLAALDEPLGVVVAELARRFDLRIELRDARAAEQLVSLFYADAPSVETVLSDLCTAQGLQFRRVSTGYVVERVP